MIRCDDELGHGDGWRYAHQEMKVILYSAHSEDFASKVLALGMDTGMDCILDVRREESGIRSHTAHTRCM